MARREVAFAVAVLAGLALMTLPAPAAAALMLPSIYGSSMVLQRGAPVQLWGTETPGAGITVTAAGTQYKAQADASTGIWSVVLPAQPGSTVPTTISIASSTGDSATLSDVVYGDVFVCSGQSNMELTVVDTLDQAATAANATALGPMVRLLQVALMDTYFNVTTPQNNLTASIPWARASPANVPNFSAFCYFTGLEAMQSQNVPVGVSRMPSWVGLGGGGDTAP
jgi:sialate O-acetylesterase